MIFHFFIFIFIVLLLLGFIQQISFLEDWKLSFIDVYNFQLTSLINFNHLKTLQNDFLKKKKKSVLNFIF